MKIIVNVIVLLLCLQTVKADNGVWQLTVSFELKNGSIVKGYLDVPEMSISKDSLKNTAYLIKHLSMEGDSIFLYANRLRYDYKALCDNFNTYCYTFVNRVAVKNGAIKKITVKKLEEWSYYQSIESEHKLADTAWMKTKPVKKATFKGDAYLCAFFFHEYNPELDKLSNQMKKAAAVHDYTLMDKITKKVRRYKVVVIWDWTCE